MMTIAEYKINDAVKSAFVKEKLAPLVKAIDDEITACIYESTAELDVVADCAVIKGEYVVLSYNNGDERAANVTMDSYTALVRDVLKLL